MNTSVLVLHIVAGTLGLLSGFVALYAAKGARLHRKSGMLFVFVMLTMSVTGLLIAVVRGVTPAVNVPASLLTAYLVVTALTTLQPPAARSRSLDVAAMLVAMVVGVTSLVFGMETLTRAAGHRDGIPPFPFFMFGVVGLLAGVLDVRMIRAGGLRGTARLVRHLWRMCFALFIAALSFFFGQAQVIPKVIRIPALLALPVLAVLLTMCYWIWRVRIRRNLQGISTAKSPDARGTPPAAPTFEVARGG